MKKSNLVGLCKIALSTSLCISPVALGEVSFTLTPIHNQAGFSLVIMDEEKAITADEIKIIVEDLDTDPAEFVVSETDNLLKKMQTLVSQGFAIRDLKKIKSDIISSLTDMLPDRLLLIKNERLKEAEIKKLKLQISNLTKATTNNEILQVNLDEQCKISEGYKDCLNSIAAWYPENTVFQFDFDSQTSEKSNQFVISQDGIYLKLDNSSFITTKKPSEASVFTLEKSGKFVRIKEVDSNLYISKIEPQDLGEESFEIYGADIEADADKEPAVDFRVIPLGDEQFVITYFDYENSASFSGKSYHTKAITLVDDILSWEALEY